MSARDRDPACFPGAFAYEHTDIPAELTLSQWRRQHATPRRRRRLGRLVRLYRVRRVRCDREVLS